MQGKFVCSQSPSTFLSLNRFSMRGSCNLWTLVERQSSSNHEKELQIRGAVPQAQLLPFTPIEMRLLRQGEIRFAAARYGDGLRLILGPFVPDGQCVTSVGNFF